MPLLPKMIGQKPCFTSRRNKSKLEFRTGSNLDIQGVMEKTTELNIKVDEVFQSETVLSSNSDVDDLGLNNSFVDSYED
jgi:hypothetical protein